jgi:nucleoside-diphosphate-sugar epimerase
VLNIACGERVSVNQIIGAINRLLGKSVKPKYEPPRPGDVKHSLADISLAKRVIGFEPKIGFERGLELAIEWYRKNL